MILPKPLTMKTVLKRLKRYWQGFETSWSTELRESLAALQLEINWALFRTFMIFSTALYVAIYVGVLISFDDPLVILVGKIWGLAAIPALLIALASFAFRQPSLRFIVFGDWVCVLTAQLGWFYVGLVAYETGQMTRVNCYAFGAVFGVIGIYSAMTSFSIRYWSLPVVVTHIGLAVAIWLKIEPVDGWVFAIVTSAGTLMAALFFVLIRGMMAELIKVHLESFELREKNQKLKLESVQTDIDLARRLHESLMPPPAEVSSGRYKIRFFHRPLGLLGGDWYAYRLLADGTSIIAVGDVTGKGVGAAMVVQSVQTLWAEALYSPQFVASEWLNTVHESLRQLGEQQILSLSMGLVVLRQHRLDYYSAGHVPLVTIGLGSDALTVSQLMGGGHLLGVAAATRPIKPVSLLLNQQTPQLILLGTDGVIETPVRCSQKSLEKFAHNIVQHGVEALPSPTDDQILVQILVEPRVVEADTRIEWPKRA